MCALDAAPCEFGSGGTWWRDARRTRRSPVVATELWVDPGRRGLAGGSMLRDLGRSFGVLAGGAHVGVVADLVQLLERPLEVARGAVRAQQAPKLGTPRDRRPALARRNLEEGA